MSENNFPKNQSNFDVIILYSVYLCVTNSKRMNPCVFFTGIIFRSIYTNTGLTVTPLPFPRTVPQKKKGRPGHVEQVQQNGLLLVTLVTTQTSLAVEETTPLATPRLTVEEPEISP